jgi:hypothetical protein
VKKIAWALFEDVCWKRLMLAEFGCGFFKWFDVTQEMGQLLVEQHTIRWA